MTFSIAAYDPEIQAWGVAVASKFPAVGAVVPWVSAGKGAIATQSYANTSYGPVGLELMATGKSAAETLEELISNDPDHAKRQVGIVDASGHTATFTGESCHDWAGGVTGEHYAIQGNILAGQQVVLAMQDAFLASGGNFYWRLHAALLAGDRAGGDKRGRQSASIYVAKPNGGYGGYIDRWIDYRVDDHSDPVARLGELLEMQDLYFGESETVERQELRGDILIQLQQIMLQEGFYHGKIHGEQDEATMQALDDFIGSENFEERVDLEKGWIDKPVFEYLIRRFSKSGN